MVSQNLHYVLLEFQAYFDSFGLIQVEDGAGLGLDLCYNQPAEFRQYPSMTYHFEGGDWIVAGKHAIVKFESAGFFLVALTARP